MSMSKQDFVALADSIRQHNVRAKEPHWDKTKLTEDQIDMLADFCARQNPAFKRERWMDYIAGWCGKNGGKVK